MLDGARAEYPLAAGMLQESQLNTVFSYGQGCKGALPIFCSKAQHENELGSPKALNQLVHTWHRVAIKLQLFV